MSDLIQVKESQELGRYATLTKNVHSGDILFEEYPFVIGPKPNSSIICLGCYCSVDAECETGAQCEKCKFPLCELCAENNSDVHNEECKVFTENKIKFLGAVAGQPCLQLEFITPLRFLLAKESNPKRWDEEISCMEYHDAARKKSDLWHANEVNVVGYMHGPCKLGNRFSKDLIRQVCGILEVNSFEAKTKNGNTVQCIYPKTAIMAHSCIPNTTHTILPSDNFKITVRASSSIKENELAYATYTYTFSGTSARQKHLKAGKYFTCQCERCIDPTEAKTYFSSLKCNKCDGGIISSTNPLDDSSEWKCSTCQYQTSGDAIQKVISIIQTEFDYIEAIKFGLEKLEKTEKLLNKYENLLHPSHYIQTNLRQSLIELYGRVENFELQILPISLLDRKIEMCLNVLDILDTVQPGKNRTRALLLYEMHGPLIIRSKKLFQQNRISNDEFLSDVSRAIVLLDETIEILEWEDICSPEAKILAVSKNSKKQLEEIIYGKNEIK